jgi:DNA-binding transcriptional regulator YiaG
LNTSKKRVEKMEQEKSTRRIGRPLGESERHPRAVEIMGIMEHYGLSRSDLVDILSVKMITVQSWFRPVSNRAHRSPPQMALNLLRLAVKQVHLL